MNYLYSSSLLPAFTPHLYDLIYSLSLWPASTPHLFDQSLLISMTGLYSSSLWPVSTPHLYDRPLLLISVTGLYSSSLWLASTPHLYDLIYSSSLWPASTPHVLVLEILRLVLNWPWKYSYRSWIPWRRWGQGSNLGKQISFSIFVADISFLIVLTLLVKTKSPMV